MRQACPTLDCKEEGEGEDGDRGKNIVWEEEDNLGGGIGDKERERNEEDRGSGTRRRETSVKPPWERK